MTQDKEALIASAKEEAQHLFNLFYVYGNTTSNQAKVRAIICAEYALQVLKQTIGDNPTDEFLKDALVLREEILNQCKLL